MITNVLLGMVSLWMNFFTWSTATAIYILNLGTLIGDFEYALSWLLQNVYYFQGVMPVTDMLNFLGHVAGWYSVLFTWNMIAYILSKIPFLGIRTSRTTDD